MGARLVVCALVVLTGCSAIHRHLFGGSPPGRTGALVVTPPTGPAGTTFTISAAKFLPGEHLTFEIDIPGHQRFVGPPHTVGADGQVSSPYTPQATDPAGTYTVKCVGDRGTHAQTTVAIIAGAGP